MAGRRKIAFFLVDLALTIAAIWVLIAQPAVSNATLLAGILWLASEFAALQRFKTGDS